jgi:hypothetical protein
MYQGQVLSNFRPIIKTFYWDHAVVEIRKNIFGPSKTLDFFKLSEKVCDIIWLEQR